MIDKSIRQHYQNGEEVKKLKLVEMGEKLTSPLKEKYMPEGKIDVGEVAKTALTRKLTGAATKKLAGTGVLSSLGPIGMIIAYMLAKKGMAFASKKWGEGGIKQAYQAGMTGSPAEGRELRQLENRRDYMLRRKEEGKTYSQKNLDEVTREIAQKKGLDINNPNDMKNIDKPITQIKIEKSITEPPSIIPEEPEVKSPFAKPIPKTPDVIIPHDTDPIITEPVYTPPDVSDRHPDIPKPKPIPKTPTVIHHTGGGNGGGNGGVTGGSSASRGGAPSHSTRSLMSKGGRVDKALGGRSRDI